MLGLDKNTTKTTTKRAIEGKGERGRRREEGYQVGSITLGSHVAVLGRRKRVRVCARERERDKQKDKNRKKKKGDETSNTHTEIRQAKPRLRQNKIRKLTRFEFRSSPTNAEPCPFHDRQDDTEDEKGKAM